MWIPVIYTDSVVTAHGFGDVTRQLPDAGRRRRKQQHESVHAPATSILDGGRPSIRTLDITTRWHRYDQRLLRTGGSISNGRRQRRPIAVTAQSYAATDNVALSQLNGGGTLSHASDDWQSHG